MKQELQEKQIQEKQAQEKQMQEKRVQEKQMQEKQMQEKQTQEKRMQGIRIEGEFVEEQRVQMYRERKAAYKRLTKAKPCGFHRVSIEHITVRAGKTILLSDINLDIYCGKLTVIIGKNGAGKSTLVKSILGELAHEGTIEFRDLKDNSLKKLTIGYVPQQLNIDKNAPVSVYDLVAAYTSRVPVFFRKSKRLYGQIKDRLAMFDGAELIDRQLGDLSGGELQRVLLTIACMPVPNLLILDEPVSGIDRNGRELFYRILDELKKEYDMSIILVSHDLDLTARYADSVVLLDKTVRKEGTAAQVMESKEFQEVFGYGCSSAAT